MLFESITLFLLLQLASAADIFNSLSITAQTSETKPTSPWTATLGYEIGSENIRSGLNFVLQLPHVYRIKFDGTDTTLNAYSGSDVIFTCTASQGAYKVSYSLLECETTDAIESYNSVTGSLDITVFFAVGGSTYSSELSAARAWSVGSNNVDWDGLTATVDFEATDNEDYYAFAHTTGYGTLERYSLFPSCNTTQSGTITVDYGITGTLGSINCDEVQVYASNDLNEWLFPRSYVSQYVSTSCSANEVIVLVNDLPAGYRVWVTAFQDADISDTITNSVNYELTCGSDTLTADKDEEYVIVAREADATAVPLYITTTAWTGTFTTITTSLDSVSPTAGTIIVYTPTATPGSSSVIPSSSSESSSSSITSSSTSSSEVTSSSTSSSTRRSIRTTTTITQPWDEDYTTTTTKPYYFGDRTITVVVDTPAPESSSSVSSSEDISTTTTTTQPWSESYTTTTKPWSSGDHTITVVVDIPAPESSSSEDISTTTTTTQPWSESYTTTTTKPWTSGDHTITVVVDTPVSTSSSSEFSSEDISTTTTTTQPWSESYTTTTTVPWTSGDHTITVIVDTPAPISSSSLELSSEDISTTTTTTQLWNESYSTTTTKPWTSGDHTITVVIDTPAPESSDEDVSTTTTTTQPWSESYTTTTTNPWTAGDHTITVVVDTPTSSPFSNTASTDVESFSTVEPKSSVFTETTTEPVDISSIITSSSSITTESSSIEVPITTKTFEVTTTSNGETITYVTTETLYATTTSSTPVSNTPFTTISPNTPDESSSVSESSNESSITSTQSSVIPSTSSGIEVEVQSFTSLSTTPSVSQFEGSGSIKQVSSILSGLVMLLYMI